MRIVQAHLPHSASLRARSEPPAFLVYHTTGTGVSQNAENVAPLRNGAAAFDAAALDWYRRSGHSAYPQYLVGQSQTVFELAPEHKYTDHAQGVRDEYQGNWVTGGSRWWLDRWKGKTSPFDIAPKRWINRNSIGIDFIPSPYTRGPSEGQIKTIAALARKLCQQHGIPLTRSHHLGHSDVDPLRRSANNRPWDPGWDWDHYMRLVQFGDTTDWLTLGGYLISVAFLVRSGSDG